MMEFIRDELKKFIQQEGLKLIHIRAGCGSIWNQGMFRLHDLLL
ncbi:MAG: hypothetical protein ACI3V5_01090 [Faecousia sp.]